jgi:hypothetical protein
MEAFTPAMGMFGECGRKASIGSNSTIAISTIFRQQRGDILCRTIHRLHNVRAFAATE